MLKRQMADSAIVTGNTAKTRPENRTFYPALDGLRAVAFLMVFFHHYLHLPWGWTGVDLFFVLSGFLITGILFDTRNDRHRVRNFYIRRTLRIFPLYYAVMLLLLALGFLAHWQWNWKWLVWPAYIGNYARFVHPYVVGDFLQQLADFQLGFSVGANQFVLYLGHLWSLCVEEQFYLFWPWFIFWVRDRRKLLWICAAMFPICLAMRLAGQHLLPAWMLENEILYRATPLRLDALLTGGLVALILRGPAAARALRVSRRVLPFVLGFVLLWLIVNPSSHLWQMHYQYPQWDLTWGLSAVDVIAALLVLVTVQSGSFVHRILSFRPLRWLGRMSYGAYIFHDIPHSIYKYAASTVLEDLQVVEHVSAQIRQAQVVGLTAAIAFVSTLVLAWLSFRFFETPFLNLKQKLTNHAE